MIDDDKVETFVRDEDLLEADALSDALERSEREGRSLFDVLIEHELVDEEPLVELASQVLNVERVNPSEVDPDPEALELLPRSAAVGHWVLPLQREGIDGGERLVLAMRDPIDMEAMETVADLVDIDIRPVLAGPRALRESIADAYDADRSELDESSFNYTTSFPSESDDEAPDFDSKLPSTFEPEKGLMESELESDDEVHRAETAEGDLEGLARGAESEADEADDYEITLDELVGWIARANKGLSEQAVKKLNSHDLETVLSAGIVALIDRGTLTVDELLEALPDSE